MPPYENKRECEIMLVYLGSLSCGLSIGIYRDGETVNPAFNLCWKERVTTKTLVRITIECNTYCAGSRRVF